jgi:ribosomal protein S27E
MMLPSLLFSCLLSACFSVPSRAQSSSEFTSVLVTTVQSTITIVPVAYTTSAYDYLPASPSPTCDVTKVTCPACDNEDIDIDGGSTYKIHCGAGLSSNNSILQPSYIESYQCLLVCDSAPHCVGTTLTSNGSCILTIGPDYKLSSSNTSEIAFVQNEYVPSNSSGAANSTAQGALASKFFSSATIPLVYPTSYPNASNTPILHPPKPYYTNSTLPNATHPANASIPTNNTCTFSNPTCPACNNQTLVDKHNVTYTVLCGYKLDATLDYALAEPLPAAYCMSRCDERNATCLGASWSTEECVLALGPYVKVEDPDYMAFVRLRAVALPPAPYANVSATVSPNPPVYTPPSYLNMSRYDGGSGLSKPTIIATDPVARPTLTVTDPAVQIPTNATSTVIAPINTAPTHTAPTNTAPTITTSTITTSSIAPSSTTTSSLSSDITTPTSAPSQGVPPTYGNPHWGGPPPWAQGDYGVDEGSRHHKPQGSWWQGGRPPWAHWGWGKPPSRKRT